MAELVFEPGSLIPKPVCNLNLLTVCQPRLGQISVVLLDPTEVSGLCSWLLPAADLKKQYVTPAPGFIPYSPAHVLYRIPIMISLDPTEGRCEMIE